MMLRFRPSLAGLTALILALCLAATSLTMAVAPLRRLAEPGGVLDTLEAQGFEVDGPEWRAASPVTHEAG